MGVITSIAVESVWNREIVAVDASSRVLPDDNMFKALVQLTPKTRGQSYNESYNHLAGSFAAKP